MANPIFTKLKKLVSTEQVAERYIGKVIKGFIPCPFHKEDTASMRVGGANRPDLFKCMGGCAWHGDIVDFTAKLYDLTQYEAVQRLVADFKPPISLAPPTRAERQRQEQRERQKQRFLQFKAQYQRKHFPAYIENLNTVKKLSKLFWNDPSQPYKKLLENDEIIAYAVNEDLGIKEPMTADKIKNFKFDSFLQVAEMPEFQEFADALIYLKKNPLPKNDFYKKKYLEFIDKSTAK